METNTLATISRGTGTGTGSERDVGTENESKGEVDGLDHKSSHSSPPTVPGMGRFSINGIDRDALVRVFASMFSESIEAASQRMKEFEQMMKRMKLMSDLSPRGTDGTDGTDGIDGSDGSNGTDAAGDDSLVTSDGVVRRQDVACLDTVPPNCNTVVLYRHYDPPRDKSGEPRSGAKRMNTYAEAVLHKLLTMPHIPSMMMAMNGEWIVKEGRRIKLGNNIHLIVTRVERRDWDVTALEITLYSSRLSATQMLKYIEGLHEEYMTVITNELGCRLYYFDQRERKDYRGNPYEGTSNRTEMKKFEIANAPQHLSFTRIPFHSNKTFDNLVGPEVDQLRDRMEFFTQRRDWYDRKGVPYQFSVMLSGEPGTGKSSCIRAMANYTRRHIINVNFANIKSATQLKKLFYSEDLYVIDDDGEETKRLRVPIKDRLFALEEIDALGTTVIDRKNRAKIEAANEDLELAEEDTLHDEITLGLLLQLLDGNMETPGRVIIVTTNQPEVLDAALVRPGRIDLNIHFNNSTRQSLARMFEKLHDVTFPVGRVNELPDGVVSPADATELLFRHGRDVDAYVLETNRLANVALEDAKTKNDSVLAHLHHVASAQDRDKKKMASRRRGEGMLNDAIMF